MINLSKLADSDVSIQFKHGTYVMAHARGTFLPVSAQESPQSPPMVTDRLEGRLRMDGEQPILTYANPANPQEQIDFHFDASDVSCVWVLRKVQIISGLSAVSAIPGT